MTAQSLPSPNASHPAPHRDRASLVALIFGISAAPAAWDAQLLFNTAFSGHACYPRDVLLNTPLWLHLWPILAAISIGAIVISIAGGIVAFRSWWQTREEKPGSGHHLLDAGEGRTRFLAMFGILTSALFLVAILFATAILFLVPLCV